MVAIKVMEDRQQQGVSVADSNQNAGRVLRLVEAVSDCAIFVLAQDGSIADWTIGAERTLGYGRAEIVGRPFASLFPEDDQRNGEPAKILRNARQAGWVEHEQSHVRKGGGRFWGGLAVQASQDDVGRFDGFAVGIRDLTGQPASQARPHGADERFRMLVQGVTDYAILMLDLEGRISTWNAGAEQIKGYTAEEIIGRHFSCLHTEEDRASGKPAQLLQEARQHGRCAEEAWRVRKDGSRFWASVAIDAIRDEAGELIGFAKVTRDITERQQMQQALEQAREQLFQAQKLEAVGNLTGGIAHDFNNLLTVIHGSIELAERHAAGNERLKRLLAAAQAAAGRAADLTHQLLAFSRRQPLRPELLDLPKQLLETAGFLDRSLRGDIHAKVDVPADLWPVEIDPRQFELALLNIGLNARDAMPGGGVLRISARNTTLDDRRLGLTGDFVAIAVADEGTGIPAHLLPKVTEPFFTTKEVGKGSGLGLSQAYGFAQQSGGMLTIDSQLGQGTTVTFYLPAKTEVLRSLRAEAAPKPPEPLGRGTVLVVEDDLGVAELAVAALEDSGYTVTLVHYAGDALARLETGERIDLVFSDIIMPGRMNGVELAQAIRTRDPHLPVLLTTGYSEAAVSEAARHFPLITKPYALQELTARIVQLFEARERSG
jgi:PAS domain S-box-containing protein